MTSTRSIRQGQIEIGIHRTQRAMSMRPYGATVDPSGHHADIVKFKRTISG